MRAWLLLSYRVPRNPTSSRVHVWRKLKRLGAITLQDAVWVLPSTTHTREQFQWLAAEIQEMKGEAVLWEARLLLDEEDQKLTERFQAQTAAAYSEMLAELKKKRPDLAALSKKYQQAQATDYFYSDLGKRVREALVGAEGRNPGR